MEDSNEKMLIDILSEGSSEDTINTSYKLAITELNRRKAFLSSNKDLPTGVSNKSFNASIQFIKQKRRRRNLYKSLASAASIMLITSLALLISKLNNNVEQKPIQNDTFNSLKVVTQKNKLKPIVNLIQQNELESITTKSIPRRSHINVKTINTQKNISLIVKTKEHQIKPSEDHNPINKEKNIILSVQESGDSTWRVLYD